MPLAAAGGLPTRGNITNLMFELVLWSKLLLRPHGFPLQMLPHEFRAVCNGTVSDGSLPSSRLEEGRGQQTDGFQSSQTDLVLEMQRFILLHQHSSSHTVPLSPINAQWEGRWFSQSSQLTGFPQFQLSVVALQAAWCYFTIAGVSVSSRVLQWFVNTGIWGLYCILPVKRSVAGDLSGF